jgi:glyoxylase-like metal-dependent hydrolase (beta-lactamase superfamily II)
MMAHVNYLDILAIGNLERAEDGSVKEANSTSTLIRSGNRLIVVDPSSRMMRPAIKLSFRQIGVFMKDVDTVVLTHPHHDHMENLDLFPNAEVLVHSGGEASPDHTVVEGDRRISEGVELVHTPGHTWDSMSVFVRGDLNYAVVGDAIPLEDNFRKKVPPRFNIGEDTAMKSIKTIANFADVIVPGHGAPFRIRKR